MKRKILALSLVLAMAASVFSPTVMAQTVSDSLPTVTVTSESTAESTPAAESTSTAESVSVAQSESMTESTPESAPVAESTSAVNADNAAAVSENIDAAEPQADEVAIDETNFPDANFREVVKQYDTDKNGSFSQAELDAVTNISAIGKAIQSLKGVEYFTRITSLYIGENELTELDISRNTLLTDLHADSNQLKSLNLSTNTALVSLSVDMNNLTDLDLSKNIELESLDAYDNDLKYLDLTSNINLTRLNVHTNQLTTIDLTQNIALERVWLHHNRLTSLDISKNKKISTLDVNTNYLENLDVSQNEQLGHLDVSDNNLRVLDVSNNAKLWFLAATNNDLLTLDMGNAQLDEFLIDNPSTVLLSATTGMSISLKLYAPFFDASKVSNVKGGTIDANGVLTGWTSGSPVTYTYDAGFEKVLNVELTIQNEAQANEVSIDETNFPDANFREVVKRYDTDGNGSFSQAELDAVTEINAFGNEIQNLKGIEYFTELTNLNVNSNQLTSLDVSANTALTSLSVALNQLTKLNVSKNTALEYLYVSNNQLTELHVSSNIALTTLDVRSNQLTSLDTSANTALEELSVAGNKLRSLNVSANVALKGLGVGQNQLTSLDVSANTALTQLWASENQLTELDVSTNTVLTNLGVSNNQLTNLDVSANTALTNLGVSNNQLTDLDVSANTALKALDVSGNQLTDLDVTANTALVDLRVTFNQLAELDISKNIMLMWLYVNDNQLTALDVSANTALKYLFMNNNPLTALKLGSTSPWEFVVDNPTKASLTAKAGTGVDLKTYAPFFDASKVSNVQGGTIDANGVLTGWTSGSPVTYTYDAGFEKVLNVSIVITDENAPGLSLVANPFSKTYDGKAVTEQELIAGAKATYDGKEVSGKWSVQNLPEMKDAGTYRPVLTFTPDSAEYSGGTIETSVQINPAPFSVWVGLSNYNINTGDKLPTAFLQYNGAVNGEVLQSTVEPVFTGIPEQSTAGSYTITLSNAKEVLESLKAQPTAKNYTIQLWDKAGLYISHYIQLPNAPTSPVEGTTGRLLMEKTFTNVPESLKAVGLDSVDKVTDKLLASVNGATKDNTVVYDVHYSVSADGQTWNALTPEQFPKEGLTVTLPYPEGVDANANDFTVMHMFTQDVNGFKTGDVEVLKAVKTDAGLQITVKGFSPIAITWAKAGTTQPNNNGATTTPTVPTTPTVTTGASAIAQTGDNSAVAVWGIVMALCATAAAGLMIMKSKGKKKQ